MVHTLEKSSQFSKYQDKRLFLLTFMLPKRYKEIIEEMVIFQSR